MAQEKEPLDSGKYVEIDSTDLRDPRLYYNRELSLLQFHRRVLEMSLEPSVPLLERLRYLCISASNMDEFFEVRVAGLKQQLSISVSAPTADGLSPSQQLKIVSHEAHELVTRQYEVLGDVLLPALREEGIRFVRRDEWDENIAKWVEQYFLKEVLPVLTPLGLDPAHPFPNLLNKSLNFIVNLDGKDAFGRHSGLALLRAPRHLPRIIPLPPEVSGRQNDFVFLSSVIHAEIAQLFEGMAVDGVYQFKVTRNSDLYVSEEDVADLRRALEGELQGRDYGKAVRLEVSDNCPTAIVDFLLRQFRLKSSDLYRVNGPVNLRRLAALPELIERPDLKYRPFVPVTRRRLRRKETLFDQLKSRDVLLHQPYQSVSTLVDLLRQAARDPNVCAIKQTLYRTGTDSVFVDALVEAARNGTEVTAVIELRARFDEEANIELAARLQRAGIQVVYGVVGYKTHAKLLLIVRREEDKLVRYAHLGTGNYHTGTAKLYTDFGLMTADEEITEDVHQIFNQLTGLGKVVNLNCLLQAPFTLHRRCTKLIRQEISNAEDGKKARIRLRMNSLVDQSLIEELYRASQAGVTVEILIRGICCLRPGVPGISDNIKVVSVLGRFLEHSRIYNFHNDGDELVYIASADWMPRNLYHRVEVAVPIKAPKLRARVIREGLTSLLADSGFAWHLDAEGWQRVGEQEGALEKSSQTLLLDEITGSQS